MSSGFGNVDALVLVNATIAFLQAQNRQQVNNLNHAYQVHENTAYKRGHGVGFGHGRGGPFPNQGNCYTHGYDVCNGHDSSHCMFLDMCNKIEATAENPLNGCLLYKHLFHCK